MKKLFLKIPVELPKPYSPREKHQSLLLGIVGGWYTEKLSQKLPPLKKWRPRKKLQEKGYEIKIKLHKDNQDWNYYKFQIHWNKLDWVDPRSCDEGKNPF